MLNINLKNIYWELFYMLFTDYFFKQLNTIKYISNFNFQFFHDLHCPNPFLIDKVQ